MALILFGIRRFGRRSVPTGDRCHAEASYGVFAAPTFFELTATNINDITVAKTAMPVVAGATYVFDLGYYDYGFFASLRAALFRRMDFECLVQRIERRQKPAPDNGPQLEFALDRDDFGPNRSKIINAIDSHSLEHDVLRKPLRTFRHHAL
jgi:hypothetical protein